MQEKDATSGQPLDHWARGRTVGPKPGDMRLGRGKERNGRKDCADTHINYIYICAG